MLNKRYKARKPRQKEQTMTWMVKNWISSNFLISYYRTELIVSPRSPIYSTALDGILRVKRSSVYPKLSRHTLNKRYKARKPRKKEQTMTWIAKNWISSNFLISYYRTFFRRNNVERRGKRHNFFVFQSILMKFCMVA